MSLSELRITICSGGIRVLIGKTIGQYEITAELGCGGMGVVYQATDTKIGRTVALKFLPEYLTRDDEAKARFLREARTAGRLDHPNVCTIHDTAVTADGQMYLVMAHYRGGSLEDRLATDPPSRDEAVEIISQIASGLDAAHAAGIVHRDIKPGNILFSSDGLVKIVDFGLAKLGDRTKVTMTGTTLGTGSYMAPEQVSGQEAGTAADVWALAVVAYELLTGQKPFQGDHLPALAYAIMHEDPRPPSDLNVELPECVDAALLKALSRDPEARFTSAIELSAALQGDRGPGLSQSSGAAVPRRRASGRARIRIPLRRLGVMIVAAIVVAAGYFGWTRTTGDPDLVPLPPGPGWSRTLAILPFTYDGNEEHGDLARQVPQLLADRWGMKGDLRIAVGDTLTPYLSAVERTGRRSLDPGATVERLEADLIVIGSVSATGSDLQVQLHVLYSGGGRSTVPGPVSPVADLLTYVDGLALKSVPALYPEPWAELIRMQAAVTDNWEAVSHFIGAEMGRRHMVWQAWRADIDAALQADSTMALAHFNKMHLASWAEDERMSRLAAQSADRHAGSLPQEGQDLVEAGCLFVTHEMEEAETRLNRILLTRPDFLDAWWLLGGIGWNSNYLRGRSLLETEPYFQKVQQLDSQNYAAGLLQTFLSTIAGDYAALENRYAVPSGQEIKTQHKALLAFLTDDASRQKALADSLNLDTFYIQQALVLSWPDNFESKLRYLQHLYGNVEHDLLKGWAREIMAQIRVGLGQWDQARRDFDDLPAKQQPWRLTYESVLMSMPFSEPTPEEIRQQITRLDGWRPRANAILEEDDYGLVGSRYNPDYAIHPHMKQFSLGMLQARSGDLAAARNVLDRLLNLDVDARSRPMVKELALSLEGWIALRAGDPRRTLDILADAAQYPLEDMGYSGLHDRPFQRYLRALAMIEVGQLEEAVPWLTNISEKSERNMAYVVPAYRTLGEVHLQLADTTAAQAYFEKYLYWTRGCDDRYVQRREAVEAAVAALAGS